MSIDRLGELLERLPLLANVDQLISLLQLLFAVAALIFTPGVISLLIRNIRTRIAAECRPPRPGVLSRADTWRVSLQNKSRKYQDIAIFVLPEQQGNSLIEAHILSKGDGGLTFSKTVSHGRMEIDLPWFFKNRTLEVSLTFAKPDLPVFVSSTGLVSRSFANAAKGLPESHPFHIAVVHDRVALLALIFALAGGLVTLKLIYLATLIM
jgi:hypothetical protein